MAILKIKPTPLTFRKGLYFKREDLNPSGSVKDRAMVFQLKNLPAGTKEVVISSSGNAGISAAYWGKQLELKVTVFVSPRLSSGKRKELLFLGANVIESSRALSDSLRFARERQLAHLRQSTSQPARRGFRRLGQEIYQQLADVEAIFFPVSSGTTLLGVADFWRQKRGKPRFFLVQPAAHCPLARHFVKINEHHEQNVLTTALVAKYIPRKQEILKLIGDYGNGVVVSNKEIYQAWRWLEAQDLKTSFEGAAALAAAWQIKATDTFRKAVCLLTGRYYHD